MSLGSAEPSLPLAPPQPSPQSFGVGQRVKVAGRSGVVRFCGTTEFSAGIWVGIELDEAVGKNSGSVKGVEYFSCPPEHGIFVRPPNVIPDDATSTLPTLQASIGSPVNSTGSPSRLSTGSAPVNPSFSITAGAQAAATGAQVPVPQAGGSRLSESTAAAAAAAPAPSTPLAPAPQVAAGTGASGSSRASGDRAAAVPLPTRAVPPGVTAPIPAAAVPATAPAPAAMTPHTAPAGASVAPADTLSGPSVFQPNPPPRTLPQRAAVLAEVTAMPGATLAAATPATATPTKVIPEVTTSMAPVALVPQKPSVAERELPVLRARAAELRQDHEKARRASTTEKQLLAEATRRGNAAKAALAKILQESKKEEQHAAEELEKAKASHGLLKAEVEKRRSEIPVLKQINMQLEKREANDIEQDLRAQLQALVLARMLEEEKLEEMRLELAELELEIEDRAEAMAKKACTKGGAPEKVLEYQMAIQVLYSAASSKAAQLQEHVKELDKSCSLEANLKHEREHMMHRQEELHAQIAELEEKESKLDQLAKAGQILHETQADIVVELRRELERCDTRVEELEDLVQKLYREWKEVESAISRDSGRATELSQQLKAMVSEAFVGEGLEAPGGPLVQHARAAVANIQLRLAELECMTATAKADTFSACLPAAWVPSGKLEGGVAVGKESFRKVMACAALLAEVEVCHCQAAALAGRAGSALAALLPGDPMVSTLSQLSLAGWGCAGAAAWVLEELSEGNISDTKAVESACTEGHEQLRVMLEKVHQPSTLGLETVAALHGFEAKLAGLPRVCAVPENRAAVPLSRRAAACSLRRLEVAYSYGLAIVPGPSEAKADAGTLLTAGGCCDPVIGPILEGKYAMDGEHHGRPAYLKDERVGSDEVWLYFWDERDGPDTNGWWFAPEVGSDATWAFNPSSGSSLPPERGWQVPYKGDVDPGFSVTQPAWEGAAQAEWEALRSRLGDLAGRLEAAPGHAAEEPAAEAEGQAAAPVPPGIARQLQAFEAALPGAGDASAATAALHKAAADVTKAMDALERSFGLCSRGLGPTALRRPKAEDGNRAPRLVASYAEKAASEVEAVLETTHQVAMLKEKLSEQQQALEMAEQQLTKATEHREALQKDLRPLLEQAERAAALDAEAEQVRQEVRQGAAAEAALGRELDSVRTCREQQEQSSKQALTKCEELKKSLEKMRRGPNQPGEIHTGPQDFVALQHTCEKGAREVYALQVACAADLSPLPPMEPPHSHSDRALESCMAQYAELRHDMLMHLARTRLTRLPAAEQGRPCCDTVARPSSPAAREKGSSQALTEQIDRIQQLQLKLAEVRGTAALLMPPCPEGTAPGRLLPGTAGALAGTATGAAAMQLELRVPCPKWARPAVPNRKSSLSVTLGELRAIHTAVA